MQGATERQRERAMCRVQQTDSERESNAVQFAVLRVQGATHVERERESNAVQFAVLRVQGATHVERERETERAMQ